MARRFIMITLLCLVGVTGTGFIEWGNPEDLHGGPQAHPLSAPGRGPGFKVIHRDGRAIRVPRGQRHAAPAPRPATGRTGPAQPSPVMR